MKKLLQIEWIKLKNSRASKVLIGVYFILLLSISLVSMIQFDLGDIHIAVADQGIFNFPFIWHFNTFFAGLFKIFLLLVVVSMTANEYANRTIKQNLIDGMSKKEFILSKFYMVVLLAFISTIFVFIVSLIQGLLYSDYREFSSITTDLVFLLAYFIKLVAFFSFGLFLGILIKRSAFAVGALGVWFIVEKVIYSLLRWKFFKDTDVYEKVMQFFPLHAMAKVIIQPFTRFNKVKSLAKSTNTKELLGIDWHIHSMQLVILIVWTFIFIYLSYWLLKRRDL
ncbi:MAG TPA: ABC transporter permease [Flavobacteriia bacterium]|nr:ABC transporter permease [Flavobacteriia bacterium]